MKICSHCGAINSDNKFFCVDCNEKLDEAISESEQNRVEKQIDSNIENLYNDNDPLFVSRTDKIFGIVSCVCAVLSLAVLVIGLATKRDLSLLLLGFLFSALAAVEAFFPQINWCIEKLRLSFIISNPEDAEPGTFYRACRKFSIMLCTAVGIVLLIISVLSFKNPPVVQYITQIASDKTVGTSSLSEDYIVANTEKWQAIIDSGDYAVGEFLDELQNANQTGLEEVLMMEAINEIKGCNLNTCLGKDRFLLDYYFFAN